MATLPSASDLAQRFQTASKSGKLGINGDFGVEKMKIFCAALQTGVCFNITSLDLGISKIGPAEMKHFAMAIQAGAGSKLISLNFGHNNIGAQGMEYFSTSFQYPSVCPKLISLNLGINDIGPKGMKVFAAALLQRTLLPPSGDRVRGVNSCDSEHFQEQPRGGKLASLILGPNNGFGVEGTKHLAVALQKGGCPGLTLLDIGVNDIGPKGIEALCAAFETGSCSISRSLTSLNLRGTRLSFEGIKILISTFQERAYEMNLNLTSLNLENNDLKLEGIKILSNALQNPKTQFCPNLVLLHLKHNKIGLVEEEILNTAVQIRSAYKQDANNATKEFLISMSIPNSLVNIIEAYYYTSPLLLVI